MHVLLFLALMAGCCGYAARSGGAPERMASAIIITATAATMIVSRIDFNGFATAEPAIVMVDAAMFVALMVLALRANRFWPMPMAAFVGTGVLGHAAMLLSPRIFPLVYATFHAFSGYPVLLILAAGTWRHRRRLRTSGIDPPWSSSWRSAARAMPAEPRPR